jgi:hypothetical protein
MFEAKQDVGQDRHAPILAVLAELSAVLNEIEGMSADLPQ